MASGTALACMDRESNSADRMFKFGDDSSIDTSETCVPSKSSFDYRVKPNACTQNNTIIAE